MRNVYLVTAFVVVLSVSVLGLRGSKFTLPPNDVFPEWAFPGMKHQPKYKPQAQSAFFADGRADRPIPAGTVQRGFLREDAALYQGKDTTGAWARGFPAALDVNQQFLARGKERYNIYCAPCHSEIGNGKGIVTKYGWGGPANLHDDRLRKMAEGEIYNTIANGKNTMFSYADKLVPEDRWAVVAYVRALQIAQTGTAADVPAAHKSELGIK